jgi:hypothetical protein
MKQVATIERIREVLGYNPETGIFVWKKRNDVRPCWNARHAGKKTGVKTNIHGFYSICIVIDSKTYRAHRVAWAYVHGYWPKNEIDHINLDPCDNRIANLREADRAQNECNKRVRVDNKLGIKGIHWDKTRNKYFVQLKFKDISIKKRFDSLEVARNFYNEQAIKYHGEFVRLG